MDNLSSIDLIIIIFSIILGSLTLFASFLNFKDNISIPRKLDILRLSEKQEIELLKTNLEILLLYEVYSNIQSNKIDIEKMDYNLNKKYVESLSNYILQDYSRLWRSNSYIASLKDLEKIQLKFFDDKLTKYQLRILNLIITDTPKISIINALSNYIQRYFSLNQDKLQEISIKVTKELKEAKK
jgi:hypothetical protein